MSTLKGLILRFQFIFRWCLSSNGLVLHRNFIYFCTGQLNDNQILIYKIYYTRFQSTQMKFCTSIVYMFAGNVTLPTDSSAARESRTDSSATARHCYRHRIPTTVSYAWPKINAGCACTAVACKSLTLSSNNQSKTIPVYGKK